MYGPWFLSAAPLAVCTLHRNALPVFCARFGLVPLYRNERITAGWLREHRVIIKARLSPLESSNQRRIGTRLKLWRVSR